MTPPDNTIRPVHAAHSVGVTHLNPFQKGIYHEAMARTGGFGLEVPMGTGKTLLGILLGLAKANGKPMLYIASKTLVEATIVSEIHKFFGDTLKYQVMKATGKKLEEWTLLPDTQIVLVVSSMVSKAFKDFNLEDKLEETVNRDYFVTYTNYRMITEPLLNHTKGVGVLMSQKWGCLVVDEAQAYTCITTQVCRGICCIASPNRILMSGTMFDEPKPERLLGYYCMLNWPKFDRDLPRTKELMYRTRGTAKNDFVGVKATLVHREKNPEFILPNVNKQIITHKVTEDERRIYQVLKDVIIDTNRQLDELKQQLIRARGVNREDITRLQIHAQNLRAGLLKMVMYLRQYLTCPILPVATIVLDMADVGGNERDRVSRMLNDAFERQNLTRYLDSEDSAISSRMKAVYKALKDHSQERVFIVASFRTTIDLLVHFMPDKTRPLFTLDKGHSEIRRAEIINEFRASNCGVLMCTSQLGAHGLNLQCASTVMITDFWWNAGRTNQSIARILRMGQLSKTVNVYFFSSNTGIEQALFKKQVEKLDIAKELMSGQATKGVSTMKITEIIKFLTDGENEALLRNAYYR